MSALTFSRPGENPFQAIRTRINTAQDIVVVTYNTDRKRDDAFLKFLQRRPMGTRITIIANLPDRREEYWGQNDGRENREKAKKTINQLLDALNPKHFRSTKIDVRFCFRNHAKIVLCDGAIAQVGSANFSTASQKNFEAGYTTVDPDEIDEIKDFIAQIRSESISHHSITSSPDFKILFDFAVIADSLIETFEWETQEWSMNYLVDDYEPSFSEAKFGMPEDVMEQVLIANGAAERIGTRSDLTLDEQPFFDADVPERLSALLDLALKIRAREPLKQRGSQRLLSDFMEKSAEEPDSILESAAFETALADDEELAVARAKRASEKFIISLQKTRSAILQAFATVPKADNTGG